jgi:GWxTD domain-containing protein
MMVLLHSGRTRRSRVRAFLAGAAAVAVAASCAWSQDGSPAELSDSHRQWLEQDVLYLATDDEVQAFRSLPSSSQRDLFIELFWARRTPIGGDPELVRAEHYRRIEYANKHFHAGIPGWRTDRGRVYISLGPPQSVRRNHMGSGGFLLGVSGLDRADSWRMMRPAEYPSEAWHYNHVPGAQGHGETAEFYFVDRSYTGDFELTTNRGDANIFKNTLHPAAELGQPVDAFDAFQRYYWLVDVERAPVAALEELDRLKQAPVHTSVRSEVNFGVLAVEMQTAHYAADEQHTRLDLSVSVAQPLSHQTVDGGGFEVYGQILDVNGQLVRNFGRDEHGEGYGNDVGGIQSTGTFLLEPGAYSLAVAVADAASGSTGTDRGTIFVPGYTGDGLQMSSVILSRRVEPVDHTDGPFVAHGWRAVPVPGARFSRSDVMEVFCEVYNAADAAGRGMDVSYLLLSEGRPVGRLGGTQRLEIPGEGPVPVVNRFSLQGLEPGEYQLAVGVEYRDSGERFWQKAPFRVD